jgi:hypothetical protein
VGQLRPLPRRHGLSRDDPPGDADQIASGCDVIAFAGTINTAGRAQYITDFTISKK